MQYCSNNEMQFEIIIVIDHSDDKTAETAKAMYSDVKILVNTEKKGKGLLLN